MSVDAGYGKGRLALRGIDARLIKKRNENRLPLHITSQALSSCLIAYSFLRITIAATSKIGTIEYLRLSIAYRMASSHHEIGRDEENGHRIERLRTYDMEIGTTDAVQKHIRRHVVEPLSISQRRLDFEHARPRWLREMIAEATGVFFFV